jgi:hypothetical protein
MPIAKRKISMSARATIELFGNGAIAKTKERLAEVETEGHEDAITYWRDLLVEVTRLSISDATAIRATTPNATGSTAQWGQMAGPKGSRRWQFGQSAAAFTIMSGPPLSD